MAAILRLAGVLVRQGHEVIVWAPERWREQAEDLGAGFESHAPELPRAYGYRFAAELASMTERIAEPLISELFEHDVDLLIRDNQTPWALVAGQYLGIPRIVAHPMFPMLRPVTVTWRTETRLPDRPMPKRKHSAPGLRKSGCLSRVAGAWSSAMSAASST